MAGADDNHVVALLRLGFAPGRRPVPMLGEGVFQKRENAVAHVRSSGSWRADPRGCTMAFSAKSAGRLVLKSRFLLNLSHEGTAAAGDRPFAHPRLCADVLRVRRGAAARR